jgi:hypothetical protein
VWGEVDANQNAREDPRTPASFLAGYARVSLPRLALRLALRPAWPYALNLHAAALRRRACLQGGSCPLAGRPSSTFLACRRS